MKKLYLLILLLLVALPSFSQIHVKENSFRKIDGFLMMDKSERIDDNNVPMALIKISTENISAEERRKMAFKGNLATYFDVQFKTSEIYLYLSTTATFLEIHHPDYGKTEYWLPEDLCDYCGYEMVVVSDFISEKIVYVEKETAPVDVQVSKSMEDLPPSKKIFLNLNVACSNTYTDFKKMNMSYGLTYGEVYNRDLIYNKKKVNWYFSAMSNFNFFEDSGLECDEFGFIDGKPSYYTGKVEVCRSSIIAGMIFKMTEKYYLKLGIGGGSNIVAWEDTNGRMIKNIEYTTVGVDLNAGLMMMGKRFNASVDFVSTHLKTFELKLGLGLNFLR